MHVRSRCIEGTKVELCSEAGRPPPACRCRRSRSCGTCTSSTTSRSSASTSTCNRTTSTATACAPSHPLPPPRVRAPAPAAAAAVRSPVAGAFMHSRLREPCAAPTSSNHQGCHSSGKHARMPRADDAGGACLLLQARPPVRQRGGSRRRRAAVALRRVGPPARIHSRPPTPRRIPQRCLHDMCDFCAARRSTCLPPQSAASPSSS